MRREERDKCLGANVLDDTESIRRRIDYFDERLLL